jgi:hypothetical protein
MVEFGNHLSMIKPYSSYCSSRRPPCSINPSRANQPTSLCHQAWSFTNVGGGNDAIIIKGQETL